MCLNDSVSLMTGVANDMGYDHVFSEQLKNWCQEGDVVIGISGSGNSPNVLNAFEVAKQRGATTICLSGKGGGKAKQRRTSAWWCPRTRWCRSRTSTWPSTMPWPTN